MGKRAPATNSNGRSDRQEEHRDRGNVRLHKIDQASRRHDKSQAIAALNCSRDFGLDDVEDHSGRVNELEPHNSGHHTANNEFE